MQPRVGIDVSGNDHHLVNALDVHIPQAGLGLIGARVVQVRHLLLGERGRGIEVAHVEGALNVMLDARPGVRDDPHGPGNPATTRGANASSCLAIDDQLLALGVPPDRGLEGL